MRTEHAGYLVDPESRQPLSLTAFATDGQYVTDGILQSDANWYPVIAGIPRMLVGKPKVEVLQNHIAWFHRFAPKLSEPVRVEWQRAIDSIVDRDAFAAHQKKTGERFAYEWHHIYRENPYERQNFLHFLHPFVSEHDLRDKILVDAGCGSGRFTKQAALLGATLVFGTDVGESVVPAYELTKDLTNVCIVQADLYHMPFHQSADITFSIGVLHHLPEPEAGFRRLLLTVRPGGQVLIWVYNRRNNFRAVYVFETIRKLTRRIPSRILYPLCYPPALAVHAINQVTHACNELGFTSLAKRIPFSYYANFPFNMKLTDAFDVLATPKSNYYYVEEVEQWFRNAGLGNVKTFEHPEAGITAGAHL